MFNARKIKQLEEDKEKLRRQIETLDAINDGQKIIINNLKKRLTEYEELFELKDQTVVIQQEGKFSQLLIGGKIIRHVTSVEMNKQAVGAFNEFKFGILADEIIIRKKGE